MADRADYFALVQSRPELFANPPGAGFEILLAEKEIQDAEAEAAGRLKQAGAPPEWSNVGIAFRDQYVLILRDAVRYIDGSLGTYIRMVYPFSGVTGVVILPVWQGQVLIINHFRHATRRWHLEIPRGFGLGPDPQRDAERELREETGAGGITLTSLGEMYPDTGTAESVVALFHAKVDSYGKPELNEGITDIRPTPVAKLEQMIADGSLEDGYLLAAYARAKARKLL
jgi:ADP-ribose pyrophosphatase